MPTRMEGWTEMVVLCNAFSLSMIPPGSHRIHFAEVGREFVLTFLRKGFTSFVGHKASAQAFTRALGVRVPSYRGQYMLASEDTLLVGSVNSNRLLEGKVLVEEELANQPIRWVVIRLME